MILDTNAVSAIADKSPEILRLVADAEMLFLPVTTIAEYRFGLLGSTRPETGEKLIEGFENVLPVLCPDTTTAKHYAAIAHKLKRSGQPIPQNDMWLAALALQYNKPILSRDQHFDRIEGIKRIEW